MYLNGWIKWKTSTSFIITYPVPLVSCTFGMRGEFLEGNNHESWLSPLYWALKLWQNCVYISPYLPPFDIRRNRKKHPFQSWNKQMKHPFQKNTGRWVSGKRQFLLCIITEQPELWWYSFQGSWQKGEALCWDANPEGNWRCCFSGSSS